MSNLHAARRALEEFQDTEALRIALSQSEQSPGLRSKRDGGAASDVSGAGASGSASPSPAPPPVVNGRERALKGTGTGLGTATELAVSNKQAEREIDPEAVADLVGLDQENELLASFLDKLKLEANEDDEDEEGYREEDNDHKDETSDSEEEVVNGNMSSDAKSLSLDGQQNEAEKLTQNGVTSVETDEIKEIEKPPPHLGEYLRDLPPDLFEAIMLYLDQDSFDTASICNTLWKEALCSESIWIRRCAIIFRPPVFRPVQVISTESGGVCPKRFGTWYKTAIRRPRVRTETGVYVLRSTYIRYTGPRSMWTEQYERYCEVKHYRYMLFRPNGDVLYASTPLAWAQMRKKLIKRHREELVEEGTLKRLAREGEVEGEYDSETEEGHGSAAPAPTPLNRRQRARLARESRKVDTTKADTIFKGLYTVNGKQVNVVLNMVKYTVTFTLTCDARNGKHDRIHIAQHQSVYHKAGERVNNYKLSPHYKDRCFQYVPLTEKAPWLM